MNRIDFLLNVTYLLVAHIMSVYEEITTFSTQEQFDTAVLKYTKIQDNNMNIIEEEEQKIRNAFPSHF